MRQLLAWPSETPPWQGGWGPASQPGESGSPGSPADHRLFCGVWLEWAIIAYTFFCLARLPLSWPLARASRLLLGIFPLHLAAFPYC